MSRTMHLVNLLLLCAAPVLAGPVMDPAEQAVLPVVDRLNPLHIERHPTGHPGFAQQRLLRHHEFNGNLELKTLADDRVIQAIRRSLPKARF